MSDPPIVLHLTNEQSFQCHSCGRCCRNSWTIKVEEQAQPAIETSRIFARLRRDGYRPLVVIDERTVATGRGPDGACLFLEPAELCGIHSELGGSQKPLACQLYPYDITATPDGYFASLSFACPSVVAGLGGDIAANHRELMGLLETREVFGTQEVASKVEIVSGKFISWSSYRILERKLLEGFCPEDPVRSLLAMAAWIVKGLARSLEGTEVDLQWSDLPAPLPLPDDSLEEAVLRMLCGSLVAVVEKPSEREARQAFGELVLAGESLFSERYQMTLGSFSLELRSDPMLAEIFARYFRNAVDGKTLLASSLVSRLLCLACGFALIGYYAEAFRLADNAPQLTMSALARAFEVVEGDVVTHTRSLDPLFLTFESTLRRVAG